jgi:hypothetical protein
MDHGEREHETERADLVQISEANTCQLTSFELTTLLMTEHSNLVQKMNSNSSWAYSFISRL